MIIVSINEIFFFFLLVNASFVDASSTINEFFLIASYIVVDVFFRFVVFEFIRTSVSFRIKRIELNKIKRKRFV